ncbi:Xaa-Pro aminopeptidase [Virgibacillus natechei]|uniref:Xaa-Pro aminopeptidase n=1 Tax=Virgibacillus natechei TaxID=1216297 RepID=A0ABS4IFK5_9BACI|nr:Xaa-Pro peptidase family protein [Virgibacillus natechei]MBP1969722.1 Xaa-Pro aminopeptidase [Virgibacillus natechei]UZD11447.1 Xaa-Pro peptidase family protein [Virgibacillus natechei]
MGKLTKLRKKLEASNLDAILITSAINRRYITGFTGTAGVAIVSREDARFITDFRYTEQANEEIDAFNIVEHKQSLDMEISNQLNEMNVKQLGFEKDHVTYSKYEQYKQVIDTELIPVSGLVEELRLVKSTDELSIMKKAAKIADDAFEHIQAYIKPGAKEIDISNELEFFMRKQGATSSSFDIIVASGNRSALPHGVASDKEIQSGELVTLDFGALYHGYCSDITRTVAVGEISSELKAIYNTVLEANVRGVDGIKPGITGKEADALTRDYIKGQGYGDYFGHSTGHGLGLEVHEGPGLSFKTDKKLEAGMVVTVEPGIYIPGVGGCRIEDDIVLTETGNERLTFAPKELIQL